MCYDLSLHFQILETFSIWILQLYFLLAFWAPPEKLPDKKVKFIIDIFLSEVISGCYFCVVTSALPNPKFHPCREGMETAAKRKMPKCLIAARDCSWPSRPGVRLTKAATGDLTQWMCIGYLKTATVFPVTKRVAVPSFGLRIWGWLNDCNPILVTSVELLTSEYPGDDRVISTGWYLSISFPESTFYFLFFVFSSMNRKTGASST